MRKAWFFYDDTEKRYMGPFLSREAMRGPLKMTGQRHLTVSLMGQCPFVDGKIHDGPLVIALEDCHYTLWALVEFWGIVRHEIDAWCAPTAEGAPPGMTPGLPEAEVGPGEAWTVAVPTEDFAHGPFMTAYGAKQLMGSYPKVEEFVLRKVRLAADGTVRDRIGWWTIAREQIYAWPTSPGRHDEQAPEKPPRDIREVVRRMLAVVPHRDGLAGALNELLVSWEMTAPEEQRNAWVELRQILERYRSSVDPSWMLDIGAIMRGER